MRGGGDGKVNRCLCYIRVDDKPLKERECLLDCVDAHMLVM